MKILVFDIDGTICDVNPNLDYVDRVPHIPMVEKIRNYKAQGFSIVFFTARNMRTYNGSLGMINANTLPDLITWLQKHQIPYDEIHVGKPWCGIEGYYIDDKAVRPSEFLTKNADEIRKLLDEEAEKTRLLNTVNL
jgi:capsule biosynthesis phosphatase